MRWISFCAVLASVLLVPARARADAPPLSAAHKSLDTSSKCSKCHKVWEGVEDGKCLSCHAEIKKRVKAGKGYHANVRKKCQSCHREHRGRKKSLIKIPSSFNHRLTGWRLQGKHTRAKCKECHVKKRPKSRIGTTTYLFNSTPVCSDCHQDVHGFVKSGLGKRCDRCHNVFGFTVLNAKPDFNHNKLTDFALRGEHTVVPCRKCHSDRRKFAPIKHRSCNSCHRDPHSGVFSDFSCKDCHQEKTFKRLVFDHKVTGYKLVSTHSRTPCVSCHAKERWQSLPTACKSCHADDDPHRKQFGGADCAKCHAPSKWDEEIFNHSRGTKFGLVGKHRRIACSRCHPAFGKSLRFKPIDSDCVKCHERDDPHDAKFGERPCSNCHNPTGWANIRFDHSVTRFSLEGKHSETSCDKCHPGGDTKSKQPLACGKCHVDIHRGQFEGKPCGDCHGFGGFTIEDFDHSTARFPRDGRHVEVECTACHQGGRFRPIDHRCADCHRDFHEGQFKDKPDCNTCHTTRWWGDVSERFDHERDTRFKRAGRHSALPCAKCHFQNRYRPIEEKCHGCHIDVHQGDKGPDCEDCHDDLDWQVNTGIAHDFGAYKLAGVHDTLACRRCHVDVKRKLGGLAVECVGCHRDPHFSAFGPMCIDCHTQRDWLPSRFRHFRTGYRLTGRHRFVPCRECHKGAVYGGLPTNCEFCHVEDAARAAALCPPHNAAFFFAACESCHSTRGFAPARRYGGFECR